MPRPVDTPAAGAPPGERIAKLLARAGIASRREVERMIAEGRIAKDGAVLDTPATLLSSLDGVTVDGQPVAAPAPARLFLYHKPVGLLVTEHDPRGRPTIYDRLPADLPRVVPVGRLDLNTEGLLLLTTDGGFKRQLELPATGVERAYRARAYGNVTQSQLESLIEGVEIEGIRYGSIDANLERRTGANVWVELVLTEGKNREVRRVLEYLGLQVSRLIRTRYGPFVLGDLPPGAVGEVRAQDLYEFRRTLKGGAPAEPITVEPRAGFRAAPTADRTRRTSSRLDPRAESPAKPQGHSPSLTGATAKRARRPGEGRDPLATTPERRSAPINRPDAPKRSASVASPGDASARREPPRQRPHAKLGTPQPEPGLRRGGPEEAAASTRPAKPQRKAGWARAKPKPGPRRPTKPRA